MATQQDVFNEIQNIKSAVLAKGGTISQVNQNVSLPEITAGVNSIPAGGGAAYKIITAELPNITIQLLDENNTIVSSKETGVSGGVVEFEASSDGAYTIVALSGSTEVWRNTITLDEIGVYHCKTGKSLNSYTWDEIETASNGHYAKYMWSVGDIKNVGSFMGQTSVSYTDAKIIGFDHDERSDGQGKSGITFLMPEPSTTYKHRDASVTNGNAISWIGSLIRQNCLRSGEVTYVADPTTTESASGVYFKRNEDGSFTQVTLPNEFVSTEKYYTQYVAAADGAFIAGLTPELNSKIKQVKKKAWTGWGGSVTNTPTANTNNTIIETNDWLFLNSDSEIFGNDSRFVEYSKYSLEGSQYDYFKEFNENKVRKQSTSWFRSPSLTGGTGFCGWSNIGSVYSASAYIAHGVALCFCI